MAKKTGGVEIMAAAFQTILDTTDNMVFVKNMDLVYMAASPAFARMTGQPSPEAIVGKTDFEIFEDPALAQRYTADDRKILSRGEHLINYIEPLTDDAGRARYSSTSKYIITGPDGAPMGLLGIARDITAGYLARLNYQRELQYLFELPEDTYATVFIDIDDWRIIDERRRTVNGYRMATFETVNGFLAGALGGIPEADCPAWDFYSAFSRENLYAIQEGGRRDFQMEYLRMLSDNIPRWIRDEIKFLTDPATGHLCILVAIRDIDAAKRAQFSLIQAAEMDELTGLLNRAYTMKRIEDFLRREGANGTHALFIIDIDNFKEINDTYGHQRGDQFLARLAQEIRNCFRDTDIIGRIGGDEFFVLMKDVSKRSAIEAKAQILLTAMTGVYDVHTGARLSGSIGIGIYKEDADTLDGLYTKADQALYRAKNRGKNQVMFAS